MADLPAKPSLDHLRRQARDLLRAAQAGDTKAAGRIRAVSDVLTLANAQLAVAREYGFASRTRHPGQSFADAVTPADGPATHLQVRPCPGGPSRGSPVTGG